MPRFAWCLFVPLLAGCAANAGVAHGPRSDVVRDVEGYAVASCLTRQTPPYLRDQGDAWASVIVQRTDVGLDRLGELARAVERQVGAGDMAVIRDEAHPGKGKALPILYCSEIIDRPGVRTAMDRAVQSVDTANP